MHVKQFVEIQVNQPSRRLHTEYTE